MATGSVSAIDREEWQLIESKSASGSSVTFNAFSGYKHLWLVGNSITKSGADHIAIRPNNNSTAGLYNSQWDAGVQSKFLCSGNTASAQAMGFKIFDVDKTSPKGVIHTWDSSSVWTLKDSFNDTVAVTSLVIFNNSSATFTGGTFYLYGIVA